MTTQEALCPPVSRLRGELFTGNPEELAAFFGASFGDDYLGDERFYRKLSESSYTYAMRGHDDKIAAAALIAGRRIIMPGTSMDRTAFGSRSTNMSTLLQTCCEEGFADWITIGEQYEKMQTAAQLATMGRVNNYELIAGLLQEAGEADKYGIVETRDNQLLLANLTSQNRPGYMQQIWAKTF